jgi:transposase
LSRRTLSDAQWARIESLVPGKSTDRGRTGADNRLFVDAVLWMARSCAPWRDLPPEFGKWTSAHSRFRRWALSGVWESLFNTLADDPDFEYVMIDATISKVHADAAGAKGGLRLTASAARKAG